MNNVDCLMRAESLNLLKATKGKTIVGYLTPSEDMKEDILFSLVLLFSDGDSIVINVDYVAAKMFEEDITISRLECLKDSLDKYHTYHEFKIGDINIDSVEIITDQIKVSNSEMIENYSISVDSGIALKGAKGSFVIVLNSDYPDDDWLRVSPKSSVDDLRPLKDIKDSWGDGEDGAVVVAHRVSRSV